MAGKKVYIVILNYNNFTETIKCLESLFKLSYSNKSIIVCDNGSTDGSFTKLVNWVTNKIRTNKRVQFISLNIEQIENHIQFIPRTTQNIILIDNQSNLGYSAGNNIGLRVGLGIGDFEFGWILNNDTIVREDALDQLVEKMENDPSLGICGSTILYQQNTERIQALGGFKYIRSLGISRQIGNGSHWSPNLAGKKLEAKVERIMFGVQGASVFVRKEFLEKVGLLPEDYFLYFEEEDWAVKARGKFRLGYASSSLVYHKEGQSIGSNSFSSSKSLLAEYFLTTSRLKFTKKNFPYFLPTVVLGNFLIALKRALGGHFMNSALIIVSTFDFLKGAKNDKKIETDSPIDKMHRLFERPLIQMMFGRKVNL